ncbi:MAG: hypothetical protein QW666_00880 [Candidatus Woesearchaeota archaeon]
MPDEFETKVPAPPSQPSAGFGLFGSKPKPEAGPPQEIVELTEKVNNLAARIRISEERYVELRKKLTLIEQNMLVHSKKANVDIKTLNSEIIEIKQMITDVEDKMITLVKELRLTAKKEDVGIMKRYVELWDPTRFVTRETVENIVREIVGGNDKAEKEPEE